jgi:hypothetical protein
MDEDQIERPSGKTKALVLPDGNNIDPDELGVGYIVGQSGEIPTPEIVDPREAANDFRKREDFVQNQELVKIVSRGASAVDIIDSVLKEIAEDLAHLKFERQKATKEGKNTVNHTISRVAGLKQLAEVLLKKQENLRAEKIDLKSTRFQEILRLWMEFVYESMQKANLGEQEIDLVFNVMKSDMVDWERRILDV